MDALEYLDTIVAPTISEFERETTCRRRAFLACLVTFHTIDYLAAPKRSAGMRGRFREQSQEFLLIDRVAHALKHVKADALKSPDMPALFVSEIASRPPARLGQMRLGLSRLRRRRHGVRPRQGPACDSRACCSFSSSKSDRGAAEIENAPAAHSARGVSHF